MITNAILQLFIGLYSGLVSILPQGGSFPSQVGVAVTNASHLIHMFDDIIPMTTVIDVILFLITINLAIFVFFTVKLFINLVRGN